MCVGGGAGSMTNKKGKAGNIPAVVSVLSHRFKRDLAIGRNNINNRAKYRLRFYHFTKGCNGKVMKQSCSYLVKKGNKVNPEWLLLKEKRKLCGEKLDCETQRKPNFPFESCRHQIAIFG